MTLCPFLRCLAAGALLSATSCAFVLGGQNAGDVVFTWTFGDQLTGCAQAPCVAQVVVEIPGQVLQNSGVYACTSSGGADGVQLTSFEGGDYSYTLTAEDAQGTALYQASGTFVVDGDVTVPVILAPTDATTGGVCP
jgi:hypothetical protein